MVNTFKAKDGEFFVDSKKLRAFLRAKELGSLTGAAEELNYTQSGMTHMMNALEKELGITLLRRGRNGVELTDAAKQLLPQIEAFVAAAEALEKAAEQRSGRSAPQIRIGAYTSMAQHWLPEIVRRFRQEFPAADIAIRMEGLTDLYSLLRGGELDCIFVSHHPEFLTAGEDWLPLRNDELVAVLPEDYPVKGGLFNVRGFEGKEFLMPASDFALDIDPVLASVGVRPNIRRTNLDDPTILSMVEHGLGLSVLSELVMRGRQDKVLALPLTPPAYRELGIAFRTDGLQSQLIDRFVACARESVMELYKT